MDDISREPAPGPSLRSARRGKGPSELMEFDGQSVDEEFLHRLGQKSDEAQASGEPTNAAELPELSDAEELAKILLAILLTSRDSLGTMRLAEVCNSTGKAVQAGLDRLDRLLKDQGLPLELHKTGERYSLLTIPAVHPYLQRMRSLKKADKLSPAALESLAVVAYRQPVIRAEVESIRGVKAGPTLRSLLDHKLISVVGRADVPGRPLQYGTTQLFLERFGLSSLKDLPSLQEFRSLG